MSDVQLASEHYLRFHRRQWMIYLLGCTAMAVGTVAAVLTPGQNSEFVLVPTGAFFVLMFVLAAVERARHRIEYNREKKRIYEDEWTLRGMHRAQGAALFGVIFAQVPLMPLMAYLPSEPSVESSALGMGCMTVALGCAFWAASFLYHTREHSDG